MKFTGNELIDKHIKRGLGPMDRVNMNLVSQTSKDLSSKLNKYVTKITDNLLINELNLDDLKTID